MSTLILNGTQAREYNRAQTMQVFFDTTSDIYVLSSSFNSEVTLFFDNNKKLQTLVPVKKSSGKGITEDKTVRKQDVTDAAVFVCDMTTAYAIKISDNDLKNSVAFTEAVISKMKDGDILGFVTNVVSMVTPLLSKGSFSADYAITADTLRQLSDIATAFNDSIGKANIADAKSSIASRNIDKLLKAIRDNITQFDLLMAFFKKKDPDFVAAYRKAIIIYDTGIRHSGIRGIVSDSKTNALLAGATLLLKGAKKTKDTVSKDDGTYEIVKFLAGKAKLTVSFPGYETQMLEIAVIRGKITELNVSLQTRVVEFEKTA